MFLKYGDYSHALNEAAVVISRRTLLDDAGLPRGQLERWEIGGALEAATQEDLTTAVAALESAYAEHGRDLALLLDDGSPTAHRLTSSETLGGVRVVEPPSFARTGGAEYASLRSYNIVVEGQLALAGDPPAAAGAVLLESEERIETTGGGPRTVLLELRNGPPQVQCVSQATAHRVVQEGRAEALRGYPAAAAPLWPAAEDRPARRIARKRKESFTPASSNTNSKATASQAPRFETTWRYEFHSARPLT